ncbi:MAG: hypothetical protein WB502_09585 [Thermoactinomyces sp.]
MAKEKRAELQGNRRVSCPLPAHGFHYEFFVSGKCLQFQEQGSLRQEHGNVWFSF